MSRSMDKDRDNSNSIKHSRSRKRAPRACMTCRARKVRCDVSEKWPCGNCTWDHRDCVVLSRRVRSDLFPSQRLPKSTGERYERREPPARSILSTPHSPSSQSEFTHIEPRIKLKPFLKPLPSRIQPDDVAYLISKGALSLPGVECQNALLRAHFEFTYPYMPILDIGHFLQALSGNGERSGQISLFLFQAVLFSGAAHAPMGYLKAAGFASRKQARKELFRRVRLLYDFNYESDRVVLVQGLLLMSLWYDNDEDHRNSWHWIDVAVSQAVMCQLHRDSEHSLLDERARNLRRRVWWSCYIRDQLTSAEMKRLPRIRDGEYHVPTLNERDFDLEDTHADLDLTWQTLCPYIGDGQKQRDLAMLFIAKANLCHCLAEYSFIRHSAVTQSLCYQPAEPLERGNKTTNLQLLSLKQKLEAWYDALPDCCIHRSDKRMSASGNSGIEWNATIIQVMYRSLTLAIGRIYAFTSPQAPPNQDKVETSVPVANHVAFEGFDLSKQFMEGANELVEPAWVVPEWFVTPSTYHDMPSFNDLSPWKDFPPCQEQLPGQEDLIMIAEESYETEMEEGEEEQEASLTSYSLHATSPSETSTMPEYGFEALGYGDIADAMFFDRNFGFRADALDSLFASDGEVLVVKS